MSIPAPAESGVKVRHVDFYHDEWLAGTDDLGMAEIGIYITACAMIYSRGGGVDIRDLRRRTRCRGLVFRLAIEHLLATGKLVENDGQISSKRCAKELQRSGKRVANAQQNGSKGGRPSIENNNLPEAVGFPHEKLTNQLPTDQPERKKPARGAGIIDLEFEVWWKGYPRQKGKGQARLAYKGAKQKTDAATLLAAVKTFAGQVWGKEEKFIPYPSTWLNGERWLDEPSVSAVPIHPDPAMARLGIAPMGPGGL